MTTSTEMQTQIDTHQTETHSHIHKLSQTMNISLFPCVPESATMRMTGSI